MCANDFPCGSVWDMFKLILSIPHPSGGEHALADRLASEAEKRGLSVTRDSYGNLRIDRKADSGFEDKPLVIMQGHLDMVCEKTPGLDFDFLKDGIKTQVKDGFLHACGTTLGADNGIGSAMALALLFDENYKGRAIAGVFTLEEEVGLVGASNLAPEMLRGKYLLNLDSDNENNFCIGCAGGARLEMEFKIPFVPAADGYNLEVTVSGLPGGHSGVEIDKKHGNALRFLAEILKESDVDVTGISCVNADNVVPSMATAQVISRVAPEELASLCSKMAEQYKATLCSEADLTVTVKEVRVVDNMWQPQWRRQLVKSMAEVPDGVIEFADEFGVPRTSSNFASARVLDNGVLSLHFSQRSLDNAKRVDATDKVIAAFAEIDKKFEVKKVYSGWNPVEDAHINKVASEVWENMYGSKPKFHVIHAGLENGILSKINPELEMISFGPTAYDIHSVKERLEISSVDRVYKFLEKLIDSL